MLKIDFLEIEFLPKPNFPYQNLFIEFSLLKTLNRISRNKTYLLNFLY
jgi:hypothetical protein